MPHFAYVWFEKKNWNSLEYNRDMIFLGHLFFVCRCVCLVIVFIYMTLSYKYKPQNAEISFADS